MVTDGHLFFKPCAKFTNDAPDRLRQLGGGSARRRSESNWRTTSNRIEVPATTDGPDGVEMAPDVRAFLRESCREDREWRGWNCQSRRKATIVHSCRQCASMCKTFTTGQCIGHIKWFYSSSSLRGRRSDVSKQNSDQTLGYVVFPELVGPINKRVAGPLWS